MCILGRLGHRRRLGHIAEWTAAWLHEMNHLIERNGLITQLFVVGDYFQDQLSIGLGPIFSETGYMTTGQTEKYSHQGSGPSC